MPLTSTKELLDRAPVVGANVISFEHAEAYVAAAESQGQPVILQFSENAIRYHGKMAPLAKALLSIAESSTALVGVHADHLTSEGLVEEAISLGIQSVMFDASEDPDDSNMARTQQIVQRFGPGGLWVEGEIGQIGGKGGAHSPGTLTSVADAVTYIERTGVHSLAIAVGSSHHMEKKSASLNSQRIADIANQVSVPLVLHGSSGLPMEEIRSGVRAGLKKINVSTELMMVFTSAIRLSLNDETLNDPRKYLGPARDAVRKSFETYLRMLNSQ